MRRSIRWMTLMLIGIIAPRLASAANINDFLDFSLRSGTTMLLPGRLYVPPEATIDPTTPRPFILFLHGGGEAGSNNVAQVNVNIDNLLSEAKRRGAFLYAPQTPNNWGGITNTDRVMTMIDQAIAEQNIDPNRLYVTGLSNGGGGTWNMLSRYSDRFAAAVPICAVNPASDFVAANLIDASIWAFHARNDNIVSVASTRNVINRILTAADEMLPVYPPSSDPPFFGYSSGKLDLSYLEPAVGGHGIWPAVYSYPEMYDWMFAHTLAVPEPSTLTLAASGLATFVLGRRRRRRWQSERGLPSCTRVAMTPLGF